MKKIIFAFYIVMGLSLSINAQNFTFQFDVPYENEKPLEQQRSKQIFEGKAIYSSYTADLVTGSYKIFGTAYDKKKNTVLAYAEIDDETGKLGKLVKIKSDYNQIRMTANNAYNFSNVIDFFTSTDNNYFIISYVKKATSAKGYSLFIEVFDGDIKLVKSHELSLKSFDPKLKFEDIIVDSDANVFLIGKYNPMSDKAKYVFIEVEDNSGKEKPIELGDGKLIANTYFYFIKDSDEIVLSGIYKEEANKVYNGSFFLKMEAGKVKNVKTYPFSEELLDGKQIKKWAYKLNSLIRLENGNYLMTSEKFAEKTYVMNSVTYTKYIANDIHVFCYSPDGELIFSRAIDRLIKNEDFGLTKFKKIIKPSGIYFIFNDKKNKDSDKKISTFSKNTYLVKINFDGTIAYRELITTSKESNYRLLPSYAKNIEGSKILLKFYSTKDEKFGIIDVK